MRECGPFRTEPPGANMALRSYKGRKEQHMRNQMLEGANMALRSYRSRRSSTGGITCLCVKNPGLRRPG